MSAGRHAPRTAGAYTDARVFQLPTVQMNHPFLTQRENLEKYKDRTSLCEDILVLLGMEGDDRLRMGARREEELHDATVRETVLRRAGCIGILVEKLDRNGDTPIPPQFHRTWSNFVVGKNVDTNELHRVISDIHAESSRQLEKVAEIEKDGGESSYSDYSDSDTESSDDSVRREPFDDEETDEEGSDEDTDDETDEEGSGEKTDEEGSEEETDEEADKQPETRQGKTERSRTGRPIRRRRAR